MDIRQTILPKVRPKIRGTLYVFTRHTWDNCWIVIIYISLESSSWAEYKYVEIFQQYFVLVKSQEDEKYVLLSQGTGYLKKFTADNIEVEKLKTGKNLKSSLKKVMTVLNLTNVNEFIQIHSLLSPKTSLWTARRLVMLFKKREEKEDL